MTSSTRSAASPEAALASAPAVSAVIPVLNEELNLEELHARVRKALESTGRKWEIVYIDDGSTDGSLDLLRKFAESEARVHVIEFSRNYGQHAAVFAGLAN